MGKTLITSIYEYICDECGESYVNYTNEVEKGLYEHVCKKCWCKVNLPHMYPIYEKKTKL